MRTNAQDSRRAGEQQNAKKIKNEAFECVLVLESGWARWAVCAWLVCAALRYAADWLIDRKVEEHGQRWAGGVG